MNGAASMIVYPHLYCYQPTYDLPDNVVADMFGYVFPEVAALAAAGGTGQAQVIIQNDSDFECRRLAFSYTLADAAYTSSTIPMPNWTVQLTDTGSGRNLFNNAVPLVSVANFAGGLPVDLPWPKIFGRNSTIQVNFTNFDAAVATGRVRLMMFGRKLFS